MRTTVRERIVAEVRTERIRETVRQVVASKASQELESLIRQDVDRRVADEFKGQRPASDRAVAVETSRQIALRARPRDLGESYRESLLESVKRQPQPTSDPSGQQGAAGRVIKEAFQNTFSGKSLSCGTHLARMMHPHLIILEKARYE